MATSTHSLLAASETGRPARELVLTNARIILPDGEVFGSICIRGGRISGISETPARAGSALDLDGDYLVPGLVDLHTDNLEKHFTPRPGVSWPGGPAVVGHDAQVAAAGITTVFDALALGSSSNREARKQIFPDMVEALLAASASNILRADHRLHIRCEVTDPDIVSLFERHAAVPLTNFVSVMDHSPGQRQYADLDAYRARVLRHNIMTVNDLDRHIETRVEQSRTFGAGSRSALARIARARGLPIASHDDATVEQIEEAVALGIGIAEFPTTETAARAARDRGLVILGGAPNMVRGGSHTGNVSTLDLIGAGLLDVLSSDYVPASMMLAAFKLSRIDERFSLSRAFDMVARVPAQIAGLDDRGEIAVGKRADVVQVRLIGGSPVVRTVWKMGRRVV
jgi:alpha-D-ribose 1-methylphosphonate 5-triphosphate diphosphatase